jgi:(E)-4-hydroxy-3-methylbut-2-enyl-diphosphate synthase
VLNIGGGNVPIVMVDFCLKEKITPASFFALGSNYSVPLDKWHISDMAADYVFVGNHNIDFEVPGTLGVIYNYKKWQEHKKGYPLLTVNNYLDEEILSDKLNFIYVCLSELDKELFTKLKIDNTAVLLIDTYNRNGLAEQRKLFTELINNDIKNPVIIGRAYADLSEEQLQLSASIDFGALLLDGLGDGLFIAPENCGSDQSINSLAFGILQATRTRISKTEYISCPSCGRTLFDLQETTAKIRKVTDHLKGIKIGIMGCIVNGPGEMADADYGYVGTRPGKITLYKERNVVKKNIDEIEAVGALIDLIKENGDWVDKN